MKQLEHLIELGQKPRQILRPQMIHSLRILQMNQLDLDSFLSDLLLENPVLEADENQLGFCSLDAARCGEDSARDWYRDEGQTLQQHLEAQLDASLSGSELELMRFLIGNLNSYGYLDLSDEDIARCCGIAPEFAGYAVAYLQSLDPPGIGARSLSQCLLLQLERMGESTPALRILCQEYLEDIAGGKVRAAAHRLNLSPAAVETLFQIIRTLSPRPGAAFSGEIAYSGPPDIIIAVNHGVLRAEIPAAQRHLRVSDYYSRLARQDVGDEAEQYLLQKLRQAHYMVEAVKGRQQTLQLLAELLIERQRGFFLDNAPLCPLTLRDAAAAVGIHESTVGRAVSGKCLQCPSGLFPLGMFFPAASGANPFSRQMVQDRLRALISAEDRTKPLSDSALEELLYTEGISISRRAVAKYRAALGIPSAAERRR